MKTYTGDACAKHEEIVFIQCDTIPHVELQFPTSEAAWDHFREAAQENRIVKITVPAEKVSVGKHDGFDRVLASDATITIELAPKGQFEH